MKVLGAATGLACVRTVLIVPGCALLVLLSSAAVTPAPASAQSADYALPELTYLAPPPVVRLVGRIRDPGVRITMLSVRSPRGARVTVRCLGGRRRGCRFSSRTKTSPASRLLRFRELDRRHLEAGARLVVFVRRGNTIGKYTSFRIRRGRAPQRRDACLIPGDPFEPAGCP